MVYLRFQTVYNNNLKKRNKWKTLRNFFETKEYSLKKVDFVYFKAKYFMLMKNFRS